MRAAIMRGSQLVVDDIPDPVPGPGQVLVKTVACGICGSDLHFLQHAERLQEINEGLGLPSRLDLNKDIVMGHEFAAEVVDVGPDLVRDIKPGQLLTSMPVMPGGGPDPMDMESHAYSNVINGGYAEYMLLHSMLALDVPNGLSGEHAALTEPMAVGVHAVNKSSIKPGETALVLGCGPVGLAVIAGLKLQGIEPIVAADFSPKRRELALIMGAHEAVDPKEEPGIEAWRRLGAKEPLVIFEAVGVKGMIDRAMVDAPRNARILVVGVCMEEDKIVPLAGIGKELNIQFALAYDPFEFSSTLRHIAEGEIPVEPLITGHVGIDGVPQAFRDLANPEKHAKILVTPALG